MSDPYQVLGISRSASDEEIKKAYRTLSRKYHPDANINNPNKAQAEEKFKEVQTAYQQIMYEKQHPYATSDRGSSQGYGQSTSSGAGGSYGDSGYGGEYRGYGDWGDFWGNFGDFWNGYGSQGQGSYGGQNQQGRSNGTENEEDLAFQATVNFINARHYQEAVNVLNSMKERPAKWYYYSAVANSGLGNNVVALQHAQTASNMEPGNVNYRNLVQQLQSGQGWYETRQTGYSSPAGGTATWCIRLCLINLVLNMCCGGSMCCGTPGGAQYGRF